MNIVNKDDCIELTINKIGINGEGIGYYKKMAVFVNNTIPLEIVNVKITEVYKNYAVGELVDFKSKSELRCEPFCKHYKFCGGCQLQHYQLFSEIKSSLLEESLKKYTDLNNYKRLISPLIKSKLELNYRNKAQLLIREYNGEPSLGFYVQGTNHFIYVNNCQIHMAEINNILNSIIPAMNKTGLTAYNEKKNTGDLISVVVRVTPDSSKAQVTLGVFNENLNLDKLVLKLVSLNSSIVSINKTIIDKEDLSYFGRKTIKIYGLDTLDFTMRGINLQLLPDAFFQLNYLQADILYDKVIELASVEPTDILYDAYAGIGIIGFLFCKKVKKVYSFEIEKKSIDSCNLIIQNNNIKNMIMMPGDFFKALRGLSKITPDIIIFDPPRGGLEDIDSIVRLGVKKIIYISCNPSTLAKDLGKLKESYLIKSIIPFDMFPYTSHIESVTLLIKK